MSIIIFSFENPKHAICCFLFYTVGMENTDKKEKGQGFWRRIDNALANLGMTQSELAHTIGIPTNSISTARSRSTLFDVELSYRIAKALHVSFEYLATGIARSDDVVLDDAFEDIRLGKRTREIALLLPMLKDQDADMILTMLERLGYKAPEQNPSPYSTTSLKNA